ncbi:gp150 [Listeria phage P100]|uniref:Gp150 n=3 Tax=Pecentumvirus P100 TaxID=330395 RepID=Q30KZ5_9CAUD|nr:gp150 [Listeria phage P100]AAY53453.1 gp150 [Listeria phage P100]
MGVNNFNDFDCLCSNNGWYVIRWTDDWGLARMKKEIPTKCPLCQGNIKYTSNADLYGKEYGNGMCYMCTSCRASSGVVSLSSREPSSTISDKPMKILKKACYGLLDQASRSCHTDQDDIMEQLAVLMKVSVDDLFNWLTKGELLKATAILSDSDNFRRATNSNKRKFYGY